MHRRAVVVGVLAGAALTAFYVGVLGSASGFGHLGDQARSDWPYLVAIVVGFGVQVGLLAELRRRRAASRAAHSAAAVGGGGSASAVGMVACCAHHLADLVPLVGLSGAAAFLTDWRVPLMLAGIAVNAIGIAAVASRLRHSTSPAAAEDRLCAVA